MENILIIGANGNTGRKVVEGLQEMEGYNPVAMVRKDKQKNRFEENGVDARIGDLEEDFSQVFENIDKVIFAAGSGGSTGDDKTEAVDKNGAMKAIDFAVEKNVDKFVMLSSMGTDNPNRVEGLETYLKAKKAADDHLKKSDITYTVVQPGGLTDEDGTGKVELENKLGKFGQISREDVARTLIASLGNDMAKNTSFELLKGEQPIQEALKKVSN
jgi:uncharacterized protein YbjT (DUF2867 family)